MYAPTDVLEGSPSWSTGVDVSITVLTNRTRFQHLVAGTYKNGRSKTGKIISLLASAAALPYPAIRITWALARLLWPDDSWQNHGDAQFRRSSSVRLMWKDGTWRYGNNPMVGATVPARSCCRRPAEESKPDNIWLFKRSAFRCPGCGPLIL